MSPLFHQAKGRERDALADCNSGIDLYDLLYERRQIAHIWSIEDVLEVRPDLSEEQAWEVLQKVDAKKDASVGITWDTLRLHADWLFPEEQTGGAP